ncbi:MAG TPA: hypothetical protein VJ184_11205 [Chryseolinea sp.]|nr:hypothetical protein [Chryseolinea sp.]
MENIRFGFTNIDSDLIGNNRFADPLGIQPIWSHFGRVLVPNLTEQTRYAAGFYMLVCILYLYEEYKKWIDIQENEKTMSVETFYILAEQLFAYATYEQEQKWELPGERNLKFYYNNKPDAYRVYIGLRRE